MNQDSRIDRSEDDDALTDAFESLAPRARTLMCVSALVTAVLAYLVPAAVLIAAWDGLGLEFAARVVVFVIGAIAAGTLAWRFGRARFAHTSFALDSAGLCIRRGVLWRNETRIPRTRIQHTDINRGPLDRHFGLASLKVYTAGSRLASVSLDGLSDARAIELRDALIELEDDAT